MTEFFSVSRLSRDDIEALRQDDRIKTTEDKIKALSDEDMQGIAERMGEMFTESGAYWDYLEELADKVLNDCLICTAEGCHKPQVADGEFCAEHLK